MEEENDEWGGREAEAWVKSEAPDEDGGGGGGWRGERWLLDLPENARNFRKRPMPALQVEGLGWLGSTLDLSPAKLRGRQIKMIIRCIGEHHLPVDQQWPSDFGPGVEVISFPVNSWRHQEGERVGWREREWVRT